MLKTNHPLIFIRHGSTRWNEQGRYQGSSDTELSPDGRSDAAANAALIDELFQEGTLDRTKANLITSPQQRAAETASLIHQAVRDLPAPKNNAAFRELSLGRWEGLTSPEVKQQFYEERKSRKSDRWNFKPVGGESMAERATEIGDTVEKLPAHSIVVTHSMVLCVIVRLLAGKTMKQIVQMDFPHQGLLIWDGEQMRSLRS